MSALHDAALRAALAQQAELAEGEEHMNDLRTAAQQALNYWESASFGDAVMVDKMDALRAALAEPETCTWWQDGYSDSGMYQTSCRKYFDITDGTPEDNKMHWCCYCGKTLAQELITEDGND